MYIQQFDRQNEPNEVALPAGYSGNAFALRPPATPEIRLGGAELPPEVAKSAALLTDPSENAAAHMPLQDPEEEKERTRTTSGLSHLGGSIVDLLRRFPALSGILPPSRGGKDEETDLWDLLLPGLLILMMQKGDDEDVLPFLLALLLW